MRLGIPRFGHYSKLVLSLADNLGIDIVMPPKVTPEIIAWGVTVSSDMVCFPFKSTLGQFIWCLEHGATDLLMWDNQGLCRQKHYYQLQELILRELGYNFRMHPISKENAMEKAEELFGLTKAKMLTMMWPLYQQLLDIEREAYSGGGNGPRIGVVGEIYTVLANEINLDILQKLKDKGANIDVSIKLSDFIRHNFLGEEERLEEQKEAKELLSAEIGGHGFHSIYNTIWYAKNGYDGVVHIMPLSCMPESTVEPVVDYVAQKYGIPLYRFPIDESISERALDTRLETFVSMLRARYAGLSRH